MVINTTLAAFCVLSGLYVHVRHTSIELKQTIKIYSKKIMTLHAEETKLAKAEGRHPGQFWLDMPAPKVSDPVIGHVCHS